MRPATARRALWLVMAAIWLGNCGEAPPEAGAGAHPVLITEAPAGSTGRLPGPADRYPAGSRVLLIDAARPGAPPVVLSGGHDAAGGAVASYDGRRVLFVGRKRPGDAYAIWTCRPDGSELHRAAEGPGDCQAADFLPDGRIVFSAALDAAPGPGGLRSRYELFVAAEAGQAERITFAGGAALDPAVLRDGRIVYAAWQPGPAEAPAEGVFALFTVHPDGTGAAALHGHHAAPDVRCLPRQGASGDVVFLARPRAGPASALVLDWRAPAAPPRKLEGFGGEPRAVAPSSDGRWFAAVASDALYLVTDGPADDRDRRAEVFRPERGREIVQVSDATPRQRPQGHLSSIAPGTTYGTLLGIDARGPDTTDAARVRLRTAAGALGDVALAADGSFHVRVPPDTPLFLEVLDGDGAVLSGNRTPFWVRPREVRGCVGCHEEPDLAPPNRAPRAGLAAPVSAFGTSGTGR